MTDTVCDIPVALALTPERELLARLLGETDAIFAPVRRWSGPTPVNVYHARARFAEVGVPWSSGGGTPAERKAASRLLAKAGRRGLIRVSRAGATKAPSVKLTARGLEFARRLTGTPGIYSGWVSCVELARLSKRPAEAALFTDVWIAEAGLTGRDAAHPEYKARLLLVESLILSALVAGYAESGSDSAGRVSYRLTAAGWSWIGAGAAPADDSEAPHDPECRALYHECHAAALARLAAAPAEFPREIGLIPLPVATAGLTLGARGASSRKEF